MKDSIIMYNMDALKRHSLPLCMLQRSPALALLPSQSSQFFFFFFKKNLRSGVVSYVRTVSNAVRRIAIERWFQIPSVLSCITGVYDV